jgi:hypothetical protein
MVFGSRDQQMQIVVLHDSKDAVQFMQLPSSRVK